MTTRQLTLLRMALAYTRANTDDFGEAFAEDPENPAGGLDFDGERHPDVQVGEWDGIESALAALAGSPSTAAGDVLREFVEDVNSTGGLAYDPMERCEVLNAADYLRRDLAVTYKKACTVLGLEPVYKEDDEDDVPDDEDEDEEDVDAVRHTMCAHCDHFVEPNYRAEPGEARFVHLDDGEKEHDHEAVPGWQTRTLPEWRGLRPDLFVLRDDGKVGPNSVHHVTPRQVGGEEAN